MQVIDLPSSPEPSGPPMTRRARSASRQPGPSKKRHRRALPAREPSVIEIIELTDSDNDLPQDHPPRPSQPTLAETSVAPLAFGQPSAQILADAPGSALALLPVARQEPQGSGAPLFLPASDEEEHVIHPPPIPLNGALPARPHSAPPVAVPPQVPLPVDPVDNYIIRVLEIVPDVQPTYALALIEQFMQTQPGNVVEFVLQALFDSPSYPKVDKKGKHKRDEADDVLNARSSPKPKVDYTSKDRVYDCGPFYFERSLEQLATDFSRIPKPHVRSRLFENRFYAPTYLVLADDLKKDPPPFKLKSTRYVPSKGKTKQDAEFDKEREWVLLKVAELATEQDAALATSINEQEYEDTGEGIECGCCFSGYPFDQMIQCPEAHLFCKSCMTSYASNLLGEHNPNMVCMDQSGCKLPFPESELARFLSPKLLELYYRVKQRKEIEAAGLDNLEECPLCDYRCVIENEMEKLFRCENAECGAVTCRACKKADHLPKSCKEMEDDKHLDAQHVVEEAMTQALMRNCPKCQKSFIKETGCNKMVCPNCHTMSCYICRKVINGYDHFSNPPPYSGKGNKSKCSLWDAVEQRHAEEVSEAAKRALAELRKARPDVDESNIKVDIPVARPLPRPVVGAPPQAQIRLNGIAGPAYVGAGVMGLPAPGANRFPAVAPGLGFNPLMGIGMGMGMGAGPGIAQGPAGVDVGMGNNDPFMFGIGQDHQFVAPAALQMQMPQQVNPPPVAREAPMIWPMPIPGMGIPLAQGRGRRVPRAPVHVPVEVHAQAQAQPVVAGGGGRRRKGR